MEARGFDMKKVFGFYIIIAVSLVVMSCLGVFYFCKELVVFDYVNGNYKLFVGHLIKYVAIWFGCGWALRFITATLRAAIIWRRDL